MNDKKTEKEAAALEKRKDREAGITLRLGPDSKMSLPIQGGNLVMMLVIAGQLFFKFASLPDDVAEIKTDLAEIQLDIESLKTQGTERDKSIGSLETRVEILGEARDTLNVEVSNLKSANVKAEAKLFDLEKRNDKLVTCISRPSRCRL